MTFKKYAENSPMWEAAIFKGVDNVEEIIYYLEMEHPHQGEMILYPGNTFSGISYNYLTERWSIHDIDDNRWVIDINDYIVLSPEGVIHPMSPWQFSERFKAEELQVGEESITINPDLNDDDIFKRELYADDHQRMSFDETWRELSKNIEKLYSYEKLEKIKELASEKMDKIKQREEYGKDTFRDVEKRGLDEYGTTDPRKY